ncbi:MAG: hypothetical protein QXK37_00085 [Candidatus Woesearchaeota archaeon]
MKKELEIFIDDLFCEAVKLPNKIYVNVEWDYWRSLSPSKITYSLVSPSGKKELVEDISSEKAKCLEGRLIFAASHIKNNAVKYLRGYSFSSMRYLPEERPDSIGFSIYSNLIEQEKMRSLLRKIGVSWHNLENAYWTASFLFALENHHKEKKEERRLNFDRAVDYFSLASGNNERFMYTLRMLFRKNHLIRSLYELQHGIVSDEQYNIIVDYSLMEAHLRANKNASDKFR